MEIELLSASYIRSINTFSRNRIRAHKSAIKWVNKIFSIYSLLLFLPKKNKKPL